MVEFQGFMAPRQTVTSHRGIVSKRKGSKTIPLTQYCKERPRYELEILASQQNVHVLPVRTAPGKSLSLIHI